METLWLWLTMAVLGTFLGAELVVNQDGPFAMFARLRQATRMYEYDIAGKPYAGANRFQRNLGGILSCVFCAGVWFALGMAALLFATYGLQLPLTFYFVFWLAAAGGQMLLELALQRLKG